ncbi:MAG: 5-(carboxyamino)imidazole ribonucleotide synthase [Desulfurivibrio sp.]|nr:5-(carboxyamino)imidazole ribonucleotide synthase [Desulfurivibrio sp.]
MKVGILGAGQLGRMLALAGYPLGLQFALLDPNPRACGGQLAPLTVADFAEEAPLAALAEQAEVVTFEFENVPVASLRLLAERRPVFPDPEILEVAQDRRWEKECFQQLAIPTPAYRLVDDRAELTAAVAAIGLPAVLKTRRLGYDGKGQMVLKDSGDLDTAWTALGGSPLILEAFVPFEREVSLVAARGRDGATVFYPLTENTHREGILRFSQVLEDDPLQALAEEYVGRLLARFAYVGVLAFEFFQHAGELVANEIAPRVHNSGHWTIDGAVTSQFENHLRAIMGWPLGSTAPTGRAAMFNFIGELPATAALLAQPGLHLHAYGKEPAPGRKVGHANLCLPPGGDLEGALARVREAGLELG